MTETIFNQEKSDDPLQEAKAFVADWMAHLGNIAARTGQALTYDDQRRTFHDKAADKLIAHAYRKPWRMPKI